MMDGVLIGPKCPKARRRPPPDATRHRARDRHGCRAFSPDPSGRGPFGRPVRRAALQTGRFAAATLLPAAQNAQRQNAIHHGYRPLAPAARHAPQAQKAGGPKPRVLPARGFSLGRKIGRLVSRDGFLGPLSEAQTFNSGQALSEAGRRACSPAISLRMTRFAEPSHCVPTDRCARRARRRGAIQSRKARALTGSWPWAA